MIQNNPEADRTTVRRSKLTGHLYLRGNVWYGRYRNKGKETSFCTGIKNESDKSREEAEKILMEKTSVLRIKDRKVQLAALRGLMESASEEADRRESEINEKKLKDIPRLFKSSSFRIDCSDDQLERYLGYAKALSEKFGPETNIASIDEMSADEFSRHLISLWSPNTHNKYINGLSLIWDSISKTTHLRHNPWKEIKRKRLDTHSRRVLTDDEIENVFKKSKGEANLLLALGIYTGLRLGDCCHIKWEYLKSGVIDMITSKRNKRVIVPILPWLKKKLGKFRKTGFIVPTYANKYDEDASSVSNEMIDIFQSCGIKTSVKIGKRNRPDCTFHSLRHTFVSKCIEAGVQPHLVQEIVGHGSIVMTQHYTHLSDKAILEGFSKVFQK